MFTFVFIQASNRKQFPFVVQFVISEKMKNFQTFFFPFVFRAFNKRRFYLAPFCTIFCVENNFTYIFEVLCNIFFSDGCWGRQRLVKTIFLKGQRPEEMIYLLVFQTERSRKSFPGKGG